MADALTVVPLLTEGDGDRGYITLDEAVEKKLAVIPESGEISKIIVRIEGKKPVLVVEGDIVVGGWQNRVVNISLLLEPGKKHFIPVSCVEEGRWWARDSLTSLMENEALFVPSNSSAFAELRRKKVRHFLEKESPFVLQEMVWEEVDSMLWSAGILPPTKDLFQFYEEKRAQIEEILAEFEPVEGQVGAIIGLGNRIVGIEVFDHPDTWKVRWRKTLTAYASDVVGMLGREKDAKGRLSQERAEEFLREVTSAFESEGKEVPAPVGLGKHYLLTTGNVEGFALVHEGRPIHIFAFPAVQTAPISEEKEEEEWVDIEQKIWE